MTGEERDAERGESRGQDHRSAEWYVRSQAQVCRMPKHCICKHPMLGAESEGATVGFRESLELTVKEVTSGQPALKHANAFDSNGEYYEVHATLVVMTNS